LLKPVWKSAKEGTVEEFEKELKEELAKQGQTGKEEEFLKTFRGYYGETVLHIALLFRNREVAKHIIEKYANLINLCYEHEKYKGFCSNAN